MAHYPNGTCPTCGANMPPAYLSAHSIGAHGLAVSASATHTSPGLPRVGRGRALVCGDCWYVLRPDQYQPDGGNVDGDCLRCGAYSWTLHRVAWAEIDAAPMDTPANEAIYASAGRETAAVVDRDGSGREPRITGYLVQVTVSETRRYGRAANPSTYTAAVQVPTFVLPVDVLGIVSTEHAERIARGMFPAATSISVAPVTRL